MTSSPVTVLMSWCRVNTWTPVTSTIILGIGTNRTTSHGDDLLNACRLLIPSLAFHAAIEHRTALGPRVGQQKYRSCLADNMIPKYGNTGPEITIRVLSAMDTPSR